MTAEERCANCGWSRAEHDNPEEFVAPERMLPCWADHSAPWHTLSLLNGCAGCEIKRLRDWLGQIYALSTTVNNAQRWASKALNGEQCGPTPKDVTPIQPEKNDGNKG